MSLAALGLLGTAALVGWAGDTDLGRAAPGGGGPTSELLTLDLQRCPAVAASEVLGLVGVETHRPVALSEGGAAPPAGSAPFTAVRVTCDGLRAEIEIGEPPAGRIAGRTVDLAAAAPVARPHLLALSIVELLAARLRESRTDSPLARPPPEPQPAPAPVPPQTAGAPADPAGSPDRARHAPRLLAAFALQASTASPPSSGGALIMAGDTTHRLGWMADVTFQRGERTFALGQVTADTVSVLAALLARASRGSLALRAGLGARVGGAWLSGTPADPSTAVGGVVQGAWWGPVALLDASLTVRKRVVLELTVESGHVARPVVATVPGADPVPIDGTWIRGGLGVGFTL